MFQIWLDGHFSLHPKKEMHVPPDMHLFVMKNNLLCLKTCSVSYLLASSRGVQMPLMKELAVQYNHFNLLTTTKLSFNNSLVPSGSSPIVTEQKLSL